jgi:hypothetical protein
MGSGGVAGAILAAIVGMIKNRAAQQIELLGDQI